MDFRFQLIGNTNISLCTVRTAPDPVRGYIVKKVDLGINLVIRLIWLQSKEDIIIW